jgi:hypothetical protein
MLSQFVLYIAVAVSSISLDDDESSSLADAVRAVNEQAAKLAESRSQNPLTEEQVVDAIKKLKRDETKLVDKDYESLRQIAETRRLPKNIHLKQFVRYNDGTGVQHGWWVRLLLLRKDQATFAVTVREEISLRRPYTQKERQFQQEVSGSGMPTLNRLVAYFDEDPQFSVTQSFSKKAAEELAAAVKKAIEGHSPAELEKQYHWEGVEKGSRDRIHSEAVELTKRPLSSVTVTPRRFGGQVTLSQSFQLWDSNLPVLGYVVVEFSDKTGPSSVALEFGTSQDGLRLVNYIVSRDDTAKYLGKKLTKSVTVHGAPLIQLPDGALESYSEIDAPAELPALHHANFELWKVETR